MKYKLSNLVLYAKGWYLHTDDLIDDLKKILELDGFTPEHRGDVLSIILSSLENTELKFNNVRDTLYGILPHNTWKVGYEHSEHSEHSAPKEYDIVEAFLHYTLSNLRFIENDMWTPIVPKYKLYPKGKNITLKKVLDCFNKHGK